MTSEASDAMTLPAAAKDFETDFWKDANLRKIWDDIVPGEPRKTLPYTLTQGSDRALLQGGRRRPSALFRRGLLPRPTRYGGLIAPPSIHILLMFSCTPADDWMRSPGTVNAGQSWSYNIPARPGDTITLAGARARQIHQARAAVRRPRQRVLQPARRGDLLGPRLDHPADVVCARSRRHAGRHSTLSASAT